MFEVEYDLERDVIRELRKGEILDSDFFVD